MILQTTFFVNVLKRFMRFSTCYTCGERFSHRCLGGVLSLGATT